MAAEADCQQEAVDAGHGSEERPAIGSVVVDPAHDAPHRHVVQHRQHRRRGVHRPLDERKVVDVGRLGEPSEIENAVRELLGGDAALERDHERSEQPWIARRRVREPPPLGRDWK